jgi:hypothetical protein
MNPTPEQQMVAMGLRLPVLTAEEAQARGLVSITTGYDVYDEVKLMRLADAGMTGARAAWVLTERREAEVWRDKAELKSFLSEKAELHRSDGRGAYRLPERRSDDD